ncbi:hypothetical protein [Paenibacillus etheri]|uniref:hypothetical protein n=1 Tax=Paenibacillus etheri TaxID=1306852 RepID=UPI001AE067E7|nr:hypothetical protein [Paenibacillus etheri]
MCNTFDSIRRRENEANLFHSNPVLDDEMILSIISSVNQRQSEDTSYNISWGLRYSHGKEYFTVRRSLAAGT